MTFGGSQHGGVIELDGDEMAMLKQGKAVEKRSGDAYGEFTLRVEVVYDTPLHPQEDTHAFNIKTAGHSEYKGWTVLPKPWGLVAMKSERSDTHAEILNELLHAIDRIEN